MTTSKKLLKQNVKALQDQLYWLHRSYNICSKIQLSDTIKPEQMDALETLSSRYARSVDYLIRKVFRSIDDAEFENQGTLIDVVNNAHKRGLIESVESIRNIKDLRNEIVHEYVQKGLVALFGSLMETTGELINIINKTIGYSNNIS